MAEIVLDHVVKRYFDGVFVVDDFNLTIADGEFIILVGLSGCGKSTTLNMVVGLEDIIQGELKIDGKVVNDKVFKDCDIVMVFQFYVLYLYMTVGENMAFLFVLAGVDKGIIKTKVDEAVMMLELIQYFDRKPANLFGGQRQRVAMGCAIVCSFKAFLMDEPLSNFDAKLRVQMCTQVLKIQKTLVTTTLYVMHDQIEVMTLGDRVVVMWGGIVQQVGSLMSLYEDLKNLFVVGFIDSPSMNFLSATIEGDSFNSGLGTIAMFDHVCWAVEQSKGKEVIVGLRFEHFEDVKLVGDALGATFTVLIDFVESMGFDVFVYFSVIGVAYICDFDDLVKDMGQDMQGEGMQVMARLDAAAGVSVGTQVELWVNILKMHVFDVETGVNLTLGEAAGVTQ